MMAPYVIAHLKLGMALARTGYTQENTNKRLGVYLTNTLEGTKSLQNWIPDFLSREAASANSIKDNCKISVVIGNPPYSGESSNDNDWINELMKTKLSHGA